MKKKKKKREKRDGWVGEAQLMGAPLARRDLFFFPFSFPLQTEEKKKKKNLLLHSLFNILSIWCSFFFFFFFVYLCRCLVLTVTNSLVLKKKKKKEKERKKGGEEEENKRWVPGLVWPGLGGWVRASLRNTKRAFSFLLIISVSCHQQQQQQR